MFFDYFHISTDINFGYIIIFFLLLAAYSFFIYKHTLPKVSSTIKTFLITLRSLTIILILLLVFEPIVTIAYKKIIKPKIYIYVDNSKSIAVKDSLKRVKDNINAIKDLITINSEFNIHTFGVKVTTLSPDSLNKINNIEPLTNFNNIISHLSKSEDNIAAALIISDGIITEGTNPIYDAEKLNIPIFTVGIGDTSSYKDISINEIIHNKFIYANKQTEIEALIINSGLSNKSISVSLFEEDKLISTKNITLSESGLNRIKFDYTPTQIGDVKLHLQTSQLKEEENIYNNKRTFFINVLKDKIKVVLIAGSPSPDLAAISKVLEENKSIELKKIVQITKNKFWDNSNLNKVDSANVIILIDFPSINTSFNYSEQIISKIEKNKISFLIVVSNNTDIHHLKNFEKILPFNVNNISNNFIQIEPTVLSNSIKLIFQKSFEEKEWTNLPPLTRTTSELIPKPASEILVKGISRNISTNIPLIISMNLGSIRSFAILAGDLWKWQLLTAEKNPLFFSNFINNIIKWLNISEKQNQFIVRTNKKIFSTGEPIEFHAELYDNTFSPIDSAKINLVVYNQEKKYNLVLDKIKDGLFQTQLNINEPGNFYYEATAEYDGITLKSKKDRFTITETEIEKLNTRMDINFLYQLANSTNGKFYFINNINLLKEDLSKILKTASKEKISNIEINLHTNMWTLIIIVTLLTVEWIIRKRSGMI